MDKKITFWKQLMWHWFHICPNCGAKVTTCWNSFTDYEKRARKPTTLVVG